MSGSWSMVGVPPSGGGGGTPKVDPTTGRLAAPRSLRVVVVEDEAFIRLDLEHALSSSGHIVVATAVDADQAVEAVRRELPDIVLMDIRILGVRDGIDAALEIRQRFDIACIIISAHVDKASLTRVGPARPHAILSKPIDFAHLDRELARL